MLLRIIEKPVAANRIIQLSDQKVRVEYPLISSSDRYFSRKIYRWKHVIRSENDYIRKIYRWKRVFRSKNHYIRKLYRWKRVIRSENHYIRKNISW